MSEILYIISYIAFGIAALSLIVTIIIWIKFDIRKVIGDVTGRNARRSIEEMREKNQKQISDYSNHAIDYNKMSNAKKGKTTGRLGWTTTGKLNKNSKTGKTGKTENILGADQGAEDTSTLIPESSDSGTVSLDFNKTELIKEPETVSLEENTILIDDEEQTGLLAYDSDDIEEEGTALLVDDMPSKIICSYTIVHTDEVI